MKSQAARSRAQRHTSRKRAASPPLTRMVVLDAVRSWVVPTVAITAAFAVFVVYNIGLVEDAFAVTTVGLLSLVCMLFFGLRAFLSNRVDSTTAALVVAFAVLWSVAAGYPFYRTVNPGTPLFQAEMSRNGPPVTLPLQGKAGRYSLVVEGHFLAAEGKTNRTATYSIAFSHNGTTDRVVDGTFSQTWGTQRIGVGRRSSLIPTMHQTTQVREMIDDADGHDITLALKALSPGVRDDVTLKLYAESLPQWALIVLSLATLLGAVFVDLQRPRGSNDGLMTTLTLAALVAIEIFRVSAPAAPGFPQLVVAALLGTVAGIVGGALWPLLRPLRRYLPARG